MRVVVVVVWWCGACGTVADGSADSGSCIGGG